MRIDDIVWLPHFVDKLAWKHQVSPEEVEEVLLVGNPQYHKVQKGHVPRETRKLLIAEPSQDVTSSPFSSIN
jgi:hypothetical protein